MGSKAMRSDILLISNVDAYVGHTIARYLIEELARQRGKLKKHWRVRVLCEHKDRAADLERIGADVQVVDYDSQVMLREQMRHVKCMIFVPNPTRTFVTMGTNVLESAAEEKIKRIYMLSALGAGQVPNDTSPLGDYHRLEDKLRDLYVYGHWCILRIAFLQQWLYYWSRMVEERGVLGMPLSQEDKLPTVHVRDVCSAVANMLFSPHKEEHEEDDDEDDPSELGVPHTAIKRVYELLSPTIDSCCRIAELLNESMPLPGQDITFEELAPEEVRDYLNAMSSPESSDAPTSHLCTLHLDRDRHHLVPDPRLYLNEAIVDQLIDSFSWAKCLPFPLQRNDLRNITGKDPISMSDFFKGNQEFRRPPAL